MSRFDNIIAVAPTGFLDQALYLTQGRRVYSSGYNSGQIVVPSGLSDVIRIAAANGHGLALKSDGTVVEFGTSGSRVPSGLSGVAEIAVGQYHSLALREDGTLVAWVYHPAADASVVPGLMPQLSGVQQIAVGDTFAMALMSDSTVTVWGNGVPIIGRSQVGNFLTNYAGPLQRSTGGFNSNTPQSVTKISARGDRLAIISQGIVCYAGITVGVVPDISADSPYLDVFCTRSGLTASRISLGKFILTTEAARRGTYPGGSNIPISGTPVQLFGGEFDPTEGYLAFYVDSNGSVKSAQLPLSVASRGSFSIGPLVFFETDGIPHTAAALTVAATLDRGLEPLVCTASVSAELTALLQGDTGLSVRFDAACSLTATLEGTRAVFLSGNFSAESRVVVRDSVTILISNLEHTYNGSPKSASVVVSPANVPFSLRYSGNGYNSTTGPINAGTYSVNATVDSEFYFGIASGVLRIQKATQQITFGPIAPRMVGDPPLSLFASSTSGLAISYSTSAPLVASLSGNRLFAVRAGTASITANQAGDANYFVAAPVSQSISVSVSRPVIEATQSILAYGVGQAFSFQFRASNNPREWLVGPGGVLPAGFLFDSLTGVLSGAGVLAGVWRLPMIAANEGGQSDVVVFTIGIFDVPTREIIKKVLINTLNWSVTMPDPAAAVTDLGGNSTIKTTEIINGATVETTTSSTAKVTLAAAVGQARYGDDLILQLAFTESAPATGGAPVAPVEFTPPLISAQFSIKGFDTDPAFIITDEQAFQKRTIYSNGAYRTVYALNVSLRSDALLGFLSDFETEQGTQANCICEFELIFNRGYGAALSRVDRITTQPFLLRISRDTV